MFLLDPYDDNVPNVLRAYWRGIKAQAKTKSPGSYSLHKDPARRAMRYMRGAGTAYIAKIRQSGRNS